MDALKWVDIHLAGFSKDVKKVFIFLHPAPPVEGVIFSLLRITPTYPTGKLRMVLADISDSYARRIFPLLSSCLAHRKIFLTGFLVLLGRWYKRFSWISLRGEREQEESGKPWRVSYNNSPCPGVWLCALCPCAQTVRCSVAFLVCQI